MQERKCPIQIRILIRKFAEIALQETPNRWVSCEFHRLDDLHREMETLGYRPGEYRVNIVGRSASPSPWRPPSVNIRSLLGIDRLVKELQRADESDIAG